MGGVCRVVGECGEYGRGRKGDIGYVEIIFGVGWLRGEFVFRIYARCLGLRVSFLGMEKL